MKKNKAFTLVEILAVIIILGLISGIALVSVSRYRAKALEDEKESVRGSIVSSFNNYRVTNIVRKSTIDSNTKKLKINDKIPISSLNFDKSLKYNGKLCDLDDTNGNPISYVYYVVRGDFGETASITNLVGEETESIKSKAEDICIHLVCDGDIVIADDTADNYCNLETIYE